MESMHEVAPSILAAPCVYVDSNDQAVVKIKKDGTMRVSDIEIGESSLSDLISQNIPTAEGKTWADANAGALLATADEIANIPTAAEKAWVEENVGVALNEVRMGYVEFYYPSPDYAITGVNVQVCDNFVVPEEFGGKTLLVEVHVEGLQLGGGGSTEVNVSVGGLVTPEIITTDGPFDIRRVSTLDTGDAVRVYMRGADGDTHAIFDVGKSFMTITPISVVN